MRVRIADEGERADPDRAPSRERSFVIGLGGIALAGLAIRVWFVASYASRQPLTGDAYYYFHQGKELAAGNGFINPYLTALAGHQVAGASHPPGFSVFLAFIQVIGFHSVDANRYAMCLLGTATIVIVGVLVHDLIGARAGIVAAVLTAVYPNIWINDGILMSESLYVFAFSLALLFTYRYWRRPTWGNLVGASGALTLAASTRAEALLLFGFILVPLVLWRRSVEVRRRLGMLAVAALIPLVVLGSWAMYNQRRFAHPVLISDQLGATLVATNCASTYAGPLLGSVDPRCNKPYVPIVDGEPVVELDTSVVDVHNRALAFRWIRAHERRLPIVVLAREGRQWDLWRPGQQRAFDWYLSRRGSERLITWTQRAYWLIALLALGGIVEWRRRNIPLYPLLCQLLVTAMAAALTSGNTRFRAASEVCLVILAATAVESLIRVARRRWWPRPAARASDGDDPREQPAIAAS